MDVAFQIATILISVLMIGLIMLQIKGGQDLLGDMGSNLTRTRRGLEKTLFQVTVSLSFAFFVICILAVITHE